jgi:integrase
VANDFEGITESRGKCRIRWYENGTRKTKTLQIPFTENGKLKATRIRNQIIKAFRLGDVERGPIPTFATLAQKRLDTARLSDESRRTQTSYLNNYWSEWGDFPVDAIQYDDILPLSNLEKAPKTIKHILSAGSGVFQLAIKSGYRTDNPARVLATEVKLDERTIDPFTREERDAILDSLDAHQHLFYSLRFYCGLRPSECIALRWSDYRNGELHITKGRVRGNESTTTKNRRQRLVPVHPHVKKILEQTPRQLHDDHIIISRENTAYSNGTTLSKAFSNRLELLGIRWRSPYNVRHTAATMMLEAGMKPAYCAKVLGHSLQMFFTVYADWIDKKESDKQRRIWEEFA